MQRSKFAAPIAPARSLPCRLRGAALAFTCLLALHGIAAAQAPGSPPSPVSGAAPSVVPSASKNDPVAAPATPAAAAKPATTGMPEATAKSGADDGVGKLIAIIEDDQQRAKLIERLRDAPAGAAAADAPERPASRFMMSLAQTVTGMGTTVRDAAGFILDLPYLFDWLDNRLGDDGNRAAFYRGLRDIAIVLALGGAAQLATTPVAMRWRQRLGYWGARSRGAKLAFIAGGLAIGALPILAFWIAAVATLAVLRPSDLASVIAVTLVNAQVVVAALLLLCRIVLSPHVPVMRPVRVADAAAQRLHARLRTIIGVSAYGYFLALVAIELGMFVAAYDTLTGLLGIVIAALFAKLVWQERTVIQQIATLVARRVGAPRPMPEVWHWPILFYLLAMLLIWLADREAGLWFLVRASAISFAAIALALLAMAIVGRCMDWLSARASSLRRHDAAYQQRMQVYARLLVAAATAAIWAAALLSVALAWGAPVSRWIAAVGGAQAAASLLSLGLIAALATGLWEAVNLAVDRTVRAGVNNGEDLRRVARQRTLLVLVRRATMIVLCTLVTLIGLSELGINIGPLLASAGVVGIAIGFGAQAIVKDIFGGISVLIEDSIAVGDIVEIAGKSGVVDWMSMRAVRLRDFEGTVHTVPFGEITTVSNLTKRFAYAVFRIGVSYSADIEQVQRIIGEVVAGMRRDAELGAMILDDVELHGIDSFGDSAVVFLARVKVGPAKQWTVSRQFHVRLKRAFDRAGIEIPFPQRTITYAREARQERAPERAAS